MEELEKMISAIQNTQNCPKSIYKVLETIADISRYKVCTCLAFKKYEYNYKVHNKVRISGSSSYEYVSVLLSGTC